MTDTNNSTARYPQTCVVCGRALVSTRPQALYCSAACKRSVLLRRRQVAGRKRRHRRCPRCGNVFVATRADGIYCSAACRQAVHRRRHRTEGQE